VRTLDKDGKTVDEAAAHFNVSTRTLRRWIAKGELKAIKSPTGFLTIKQEFIEEYESRSKLVVPSQEGGL